MSDEIILRGHHGLCFSFFVGKGYSDKFTDNLTKIVNMLNSDNPQICLADDFDIACENCPHKGEEHCQKCGTIGNYDRKILSLCKKSPGDIISWKCYNKLVIENVVKPQENGFICDSCNWKNICHEMIGNIVKQI